MGKRATASNVSREREEEKRCGQSLKAGENPTNHGTALPDSRER